MNLTCYVVDDQDYSIEALSNYIARTPDLLLVGSNTNPIIALKEISNSKPDLVFLDVEMPELSGIAVAELMGPEIAVVFTTAHSKYAVKAFEKDAIDFLLKPFSFEIFLKSISKIRTKIALTKNKQPQPAQSHIFVNPGTKGKIIQLELATISHIEAVDHSILIYLPNEKVLTHMNFTTVQQKLPQDVFLRIHRSFIVNRLHIKVIDGKKIVLSNGLILPLGDQYRKTLMNAVQG